MRGRARCQIRGHLVGLSDVEIREAVFEHEHRHVEDIIDIDFGTILDNVEPAYLKTGIDTPTATVLHAVVREHLESFLAAARERSGHGYGVPRHVERELRNYLACGVLAHGFVRVRCVECGFDRLLAFSCKGRAVCPSCRGRRMADAAAHLVDRVLPCAPYRQWTLSVPWRLRALLARDRRLLSAALTCFVRAVFRWQRGRARARGLVGASPGAVTAIQRFGSVLNLNVHFYTLVPDGVFVPGGDGGARFVPLPAWTPLRGGLVVRVIDRAEAVAVAVLAIAARARVVGFVALSRRGRWPCGMSREGSHRPLRVNPRATQGPAPAGGLRRRIDRGAGSDRREA